MKINLNDTVKIRLTNAGRKFLLDQHTAWCMTLSPTTRENQLAFNPLPKEDDDGYSKWQMQCLFSTFGSNISMCLPLLFDTNIIYEDGQW